MAGVPPKIMDNDHVSSELTSVRHHLRAIRALKRFFNFNFFLRRVVERFHVCSQIILIAKCARAQLAFCALLLDAFVSQHMISQRVLRCVFVATFLALVTEVLVYDFDVVVQVGFPFETVFLETNREIHTEFGDKSMGIYRFLQMSHSKSYRSLSGPWHAVVCRLIYFLFLNFFPHMSHSYKFGSVSCSFGVSLYVAWCLF